MFFYLRQLWDDLLGVLALTDYWPDAEGDESTEVPADA